MFEVLHWIGTLGVLFLTYAGVGIFMFIMFGPSGSKEFLKNTFLNIIHPNRNH